MKARTLVPLALLALGWLLRDMDWRLAVPAVIAATPLLMFIVNYITHGRLWREMRTILGKG